VAGALSCRVREGWPEKDQVTKIVLGNKNKARILNFFNFLLHSE
jgi:hypothetical protein